MGKVLLNGDRSSPRSERITPKKCGPALKKGEPLQRTKNFFLQIKEIPLRKVLPLPNYNYLTT